MKKLYLYYNNDSFRGPGAVVKNLKAGLSSIEEEVGVVLTDKPGSADMIGCLQTPDDQLMSFLPKDALMGPNLFVIPPENPRLISKFDDFIVPSFWVRGLYQQFDEMAEKNIRVWPVGIRHDLWAPIDDVVEEEDRLDCFVYFKNREEEELAEVEASLKRLGLSFQTMRYGSYEESQLVDLCSRSKFAILLTGTESQGIAYMNILSTNTPCLSFAKEWWVYDGSPQIRCYAESTPCFNYKCGKILRKPVKKPDEDIEDFTTMLHEFNPRQFITEFHCYKDAARKYVKLFEKEQ